MFLRIQTLTPRVWLCDSRVVLTLRLSWPRVQWHPLSMWRLTLYAQSEWPRIHAESAVFELLTVLMIVPILNKKELDMRRIVVGIRYIYVICFVFERYCRV